MEPIALGLPTVIGPNFSDFADTMSALQEAGGIEVTDGAGLAFAVRRLLTDRAAATQLAAAGRAVIHRRQGSTARHVALLLTLLRRR